MAAVSMAGMRGLHGCILPAAASSAEPSPGEPNTPAIG